ncbi:MAG: tRNA epoxyqueuosine(34) reductase QueG [Nitrospirota bacterium]|nr:tRNA epoxyqueuosine(34) reductase QueG [Nitrospirota bacterium]
MPVWSGKDYLLLINVSDSIKQVAKDLGFQAVGIARVSDPGHFQQESNQHTSYPTPSSPGLLPSLLDWLARGYHGTMGWMANNPHRRSDPTAVLPGCRSMVCVGMNYSTNHQADEGRGKGRIARYAWGKDYHWVMEKRLKKLEQHIQDLAPEAKTRRYVDTGPIMEKAWAQQAGLGWIGKHSNLVSPTYGSWLLLGEILTTLDLEIDEPGTDLCGSCSLCLHACPTQAMPEPYVVDATRCISYLTIEYRGSPENIPHDLRRKLGNRIFGCDDCLDACPYNINATQTEETAFLPSKVTLAPDLEVLAQMTEEEFAETFRTSPIRRAKYAGFQRNVRLALASEHNPAISAQRR